MDNNFTLQLPNWLVQAHNNSGTPKRRAIHILCYASPDSGVSRTRVARKGCITHNEGVRGGNMRANVSPIGRR